MKTQQPLGSCFDIPPAFQFGGHADNDENVIKLATASTKKYRIATPKNCS